MIFETGNDNNRDQYPGIGRIGLKNVLSNAVYNMVVSAFYDKNLKSNYVLEFNTTSSLSNDLHINYSFQKDYYIGKIIRYIYKNISDAALMEKIADAVKCPNFSNKADILTYDFYGLMGGTQKVDFEIEVYKRHDIVFATTYYIVQLDLTIHDWFGSDIEDIQGPSVNIKNNMACLGAFFWLQHHYGYSPFETQLKFRDYVIITKRQ